LPLKLGQRFLPSRVPIGRTLAAHVSLRLRRGRALPAAKYLDKGRGCVGHLTGNPGGSETACGSTDRHERRDGHCVNFKRECVLWQQLTNPVTGANATSRRANQGHGQAISSKCRPFARGTSSSSPDRKGFRLPVAPLQAVIATGKRALTTHSAISTIVAYIVCGDQMIESNPCEAAKKGRDAPSRLGRGGSNALRRLQTNIAAAETGGSAGVQHPIEVGR
jgi:hypothetical protein